MCEDYIWKAIISHPILIFIWFFGGLDRYKLDSLNEKTKIIGQVRLLAGDIKKKNNFFQVCS